MSDITNSPAYNRINGLLDENSFVELGGLMTARSTDFNPNPQKENTDGVIAGHGLIDGNLVYIFSQDVSVLGGTMGEMHAKKILGIYDMAMKVGAPVIGLLDTKGIRLQESLDGAEALALVAAKAAAASGVIPVIGAVFGSLGGGMSIIPSLSDFVFMEEGAHLFFNSPDAIEGNFKDKYDPSSSENQLKSGSVDFVGKEPELLKEIRNLICLIPGSSVEDGRLEASLDDPNRGVDLSGKESNMESFLEEIADSGNVFITKPGFAPEMMTAIIRLNGRSVGVVANSPKEGETSAKLSAMGARKAADFVRYCDAFEIPVLTITNVDGYEVSLQTEERMAITLGSFVTSLSNAGVAKISLVINASSSAYLFMNTKSLGADLVYAYPDSKIEIMKAADAASIIAEDGEDSSKIAAAYQADCTGAVNAARRGYVDRILNREDTRKYLIDGFEMLYTKSAGIPYKKHESR